MMPTSASPSDPAAGYAQPWVVAPGQAVALHASLPQATKVDIVRLACVHDELQADGQPHGAAERIEPVPDGPTGPYGPAVQPLAPGTQVTAACSGLPAWPDCCVVLALQRSARGAPGHVLSLRNADDAGLRIELAADAGAHAALSVMVALGDTKLQLVLPANEWLLLVLDFVDQPTQPGAWRLRARTALCRTTVPSGVPPAWHEQLLPLATLAQSAPDSLHLGSLEGGMVSADLRLDLVSVLPAACMQVLRPADLLADAEVAGDAGAAGDDARPTLSPWEHAALREPSRACLLRGRVGQGHSVQDLAARAAITEPQRPYSAVRGIRWCGRYQSPLQAPAHYTALHLNSDTLLDARWAPTLSWRVPPDLASGSYAFRLRDPARPELAPSYASFFVSAATRPQQPLAVLLPTFTYLAYANAPEDMRGERVTDTPHLAEQRLDALHPAHGRSIYERHRDGQGVLWASSRRPLWSVSPGHRPWGLAADSCLLDWLDQQGQAYDVITDHDLHRLGAAALQPYRVVLTGHHPEYTSTAMWDGLWSYLQQGGRLMYLGGNGFYWRTAFDESAQAIEVRRAEDGTRPSIAPPGEYHCAFSGEYGGLWRRLGRPPQQLVGLGMAAQGFEHAAHYRKCADAHAPEAAFVFEGVHAETFGHSGWWGGGASGWEIDRCDADLGTPAQTRWLARSEGHAPSMLRTKEELLSYVLPFEDSKARSDVVLAPLGQGDVFAVGSMTWIGSLHGTGQEPTDVATITANVIRRFLDPTPLPRKPEHE